MTSTLPCTVHFIGTMMCLCTVMKSRLVIFYTEVCINNKVLCIQRSEASADLLTHGSGSFFVTVF